MKKVSTSNLWDGVGTPPRTTIRLATIALLIMAHAPVGHSQNSLKPGAFAPGKATQLFNQMAANESKQPKIPGSDLLAEALNVLPKKSQWHSLLTPEEQAAGLRILSRCNTSQNPRDCEKQVDAQLEAVERERQQQILTGTPPRPLLSDAYAKWLAGLPDWHPERKQAIDVMAALEVQAHRNASPKVEALSDQRKEGAECLQRELDAKSREKSKLRLDEQWNDPEKSKNLRQWIDRMAKSEGSHFSSPEHRKAYRAQSEHYVTEVGKISESVAGCFTKVCRENHMIRAAIEQEQLDQCRNSLSSCQQGRGR